MKRCQSISHVMHEFSRFKMIKHDQDSGNKRSSARYNQLLHAGDTMDFDGYNELPNLYKLKITEVKERYVNFSVEIDNSVDPKRFDHLKSVDYHKILFKIHALICFGFIVVFYKQGKLKGIRYSR